MSVAVRRPASPYARRLARERGFALELITGTGPDGRIVAADVERFIPPRAAPGPQATAVAAVSAFAMTINLGMVQKLLADFGGAQLSLSLDDMLLRSAALALEAVPGANPGAGSGVAWETGSASSRRQIIVEDAHKGLISQLHLKLAEGLATGHEEGGRTAALSIRRIAEAGIRPTALPLLPDYSMRLVVAAADLPSGTACDCLLCFSADAVGEDEAAAFLARFRDNLETPLRLLA